MKVYSIGREIGCDIVINDSTDVISRRHAVLNVSPSGKMTIIDQSHNGTYVNGIRISPNVPVPVTRKDNISFAHVARLDWSLVPKSNAIQKYIVIVVVAIIIVAGAVFGFKTLYTGNNTPPSTADTTAIVDSAKKDSTVKKDSIKEEKKAEKTDSAKKVSKNKSAEKRVEKKGSKKASSQEKKEEVKKQTPKEKKNDSKKEEKNEDKVKRLH